MSALAVPTGYEPPALAWETGPATEQSAIIIWVIWVFTLSAALAWASYCIYVGGSPDIDIGWFRIKVACWR